MFIYGADFFVLKPGLVLALFGLIGTVAVSFGNLKIGAVTLSLNWQFLAVAAFVVGLQAVFLGGHRAGAVRLHRQTDQTLASRLSVHPNGVLRRSADCPGDRLWRSRSRSHTSTTTWR